MTDRSGPSGFDGHHPPSAELISDCVHCGFCLPTCPTYLLWGEEMDSPRGPDPPDEAGARGRRRSTPTMIGSLRQLPRLHVVRDRVPVRGAVRRADRGDPRRRSSATSSARRRTRRCGALIFSLFPYPRRLALLRGPLRAYQRSGLGRLVRRSGLLDRLPPTLGAMEGLLPELARDRAGARRSLRRSGDRRARVGMLLGCVQREFFPGVNAATARVLAAEGCDVVAPPGQQCCGALSLHVGREDGGAGARQAADRDVRVAGGRRDRGQRRRLRLVDEGLRAAARRRPGVGARGPPRSPRSAVDVSELLAELGPVATRHPLPVVAAYHDACHLAHAQGVRAQPRELLAGDPGAGGARDRRRRTSAAARPASTTCSSPSRPASSATARRPNVVATGADCSITANPGCLMQVRQRAAPCTARSIALAHTVEVLDASIRGLGPAPSASGDPRTVTGARTPVGHHKLGRRVSVGALVSGVVTTAIWRQRDRRRGLTKSFGDVHALGRHRPRGPARHRARRARPERRGQDHRGQDPDDADPAGLRDERWSTGGRGHRPGRGPAVDRAGRPVGRDHRRAQRSGEPRDHRPALPPQQARVEGAGDRAARALRPHRRGRPPRQDLLRRHDAPPRPGRQSWSRGRRCCFSTSRRPGSTRGRATTCGRSSATSSPPARRCC